MKSILIKSLIAASVSSVLFVACQSKQTESATSSVAEAPALGGQSSVKDDASAKNVVQVAVASKDHSTLVTAVTSADLVDALSNAGPFTVFAPTNAAFAKLPEGTLEGLLKPEKKNDLQNILQYHVAVGVYQLENLNDGQKLGMVNGDNVTFTMKDGKLTINGASIIGTVKASNGVVYIIDNVLLPPSK
ncbi:MAG: fasciclin domain-containing protein [Bacteroidetes bacterium]|nr:fasciclin domain-containing protein [Bacteroidota bacterium]